MKPAEIFLTLSLLSILFLTMTGCTSNDTNMADDNSKIQVVATFYPIYDIAKKIGGEKIKVYSLIPSGVEPHDYEPNPQDIIRLNKADIFIVIGLEFSNIEKELMEITSTNVKVIDSIKGIPLLDAEKTSNVHKDKEDNNMGKDPHIWLSPKNMITVAKNIKEGLIQTEPENKKYYEQNADKVITELQMLDTDFRKMLSNCKKDIILVNHLAFAYLANEYGFRQIGIAGLSQESEPSPQQLVKLKELALKNNIKYIFYEELVEPRIAQTIAKEISGNTLVLNPIEGSDKLNEDYISLMRKNLANLKLGLECA